MKILKDTSNGSNALALLDRNKCFSVVAAAVKNAVSDSVVDLKSPAVNIYQHFLLLVHKHYTFSRCNCDGSIIVVNMQLSVLVELLPLSGIPNGELVVAVSVLPQKLVNTKPRLCIKALVSDVKARDGKH